MSASTDNETFVVYKKRFLIILLVSFYNLLYSFQTYEFTIIGNIIKYYYDVSDQLVALTSVINFVTVAVCIFVFGSLFKKYGVRFTFIVASFSMCIATTIKCFCVDPHRFGFWLFGQFFAALGYSLSSPLVVQVSRLWFPRNEVNRASTVGITFVTVGTLLSFILPVVLVPNTTDKLAITKGISIISIGQTIIAAVIFVLAVLFFDDKPPTPPSRSQREVESAAIQEPYFSQLKRALSRSFVLVALVYGFNTGGRFAFNALLNQLLITKLHHNTYYVGLVGVCGALARIIICYITSHFLDVNRKYKLMVYLYSTITAALLLIFAFTLNTTHVVLIIVFGILIGGAMGPNTSTLMNLGAELTHPIPGSIANAVMVFVSYVFAGILIPVVSVALQKIGSFDTILIDAAVTILIIILIYFVKYDARRVSFVAENIPIHTERHAVTERTALLRNSFSEA